MTSQSKILAFFAAGTMWLAGSPAAWPAEPSAGQAVAKVIALTGEAKAGARGLKIGDSVAEGDEIASGRGSYAMLEFTDQSVVRVMADSRLSIEVHHLPAPQAEAQTRLRLGAGAIEAIVAKRIVPNFTVVSMAGSIAARGTSFRVRGGGDSMLVEVLEGRVEVSGNAGGPVAVNAGFGTRVAAMEAALAPVELLGAPNISRVVELQQRPVVRLRFAPIAGAQSYRVIAAADRDLREILVENTQRRPDVRMIDMRDGEYFYSVRAVDALGLEGLEARGRFRLKARPLPPAAQAPESDVVLEPGSVAFSWAAVEEAAAYYFQLATDDTFKSPRVSRGGLTAREIMVDKLEAGTYYWRIASVRASGDQGPFGDPQILTLQAPTPAPAPQAQ
jgi:hypothetical protein